MNLLTPVAHGEAYAWLVAADLLQDVKSTGARAAFTMQVLEEAKHFVVLRELIQAFDTTGMPGRNLMVAVEAGGERIAAAQVIAADRR